MSPSSILLHPPAALLLMSPSSIPPPKAPTIATVVTLVDLAIVIVHDIFIGHRHPQHQLMHEPSHSSTDPSIMSDFTAQLQIFSPM
ncbi:hypothetical protein PoB_003520400 [Plakobranchus ocellatus]|uniref:Uncharacterized protein n=1 Tax=Plakobranchus ocellatus TaxID=259542 RepID=A0AAV4ARE4_9GAST|nr:hypothetical protein PoB_003520400 [Plakobranchus ocellatus]